MAHNNSTVIVNPHIVFPAVVLGLGVCSVSIISAFIILLLLIRRPPYLLDIGPGRFLFLGLTFADLITAVGYVVGLVDQYFAAFGPVSNSVCIGQAFTTIWSANSANLWTVGITLHWIVSASQRSSQLTLAKWEKVLCIAVCCGLPMCLAIFGLCERMLGPDKALSVAGWCLIASWPPLPVYKRILWLSLAGMGPELLCCVGLSITLILHIFLVYSRERSRLRYAPFGDNDSSVSIQAFEDDSTSETNSLAEQAIVRSGRKVFYWIPMAFIVTRLWGTFRLASAIHHILKEDHQENMSPFSYILLYIQAVGSGTQATCNLLLLIATQGPLQHRLRSFFQSEYR